MIATVTQSDPVEPAEAFIHGGQRRLRTLVVCAAPLGPGMPLDLRREWALLRRHAEESRVPVTLSRLLPPTPEAFTRALQQCAERKVTPHIVHFAGHGHPGTCASRTSLARRHGCSTRIWLQLCMPPGYRLSCSTLAIRRPGRSCLWPGTWSMMHFDTAKRSGIALTSWRQQ